VEAWGGGGGGRSNWFSGGGGGGGYNYVLLPLSDLGSSETVTVGSGGSPGSAGGNSSFGSHLTAYGGGRGQENGGDGGGQLGVGQVAGGGGFSSDPPSSGGSSFYGGGGGGGAAHCCYNYGGDGGFSIYGGGGGGGIGHSFSGGNGGNSLHGGDGGDYGQNGNPPGGGGGGNASGARGEVRITVYAGGGSGGGDDLGDHTATQTLDLRGNALKKEFNTFDPSGDMANWTMVNNDGAGNFSQYFNSTTGTSPVYETDGPAYRWLYNGRASGALSLQNAPVGNNGDPIAWNTQLHLAPDGNVGIGTSSPSTRLDLGNSGGDLTIYDGNGTPHIFGDEVSGETDGIVLRTLGNPASGEPIFVVESSGHSQRLRVEHDGYTSTSNNMQAKAYYHSSDVRLKREFESLENKNILDKVLQLNPVFYKWNTDIDEEGRLQIGLIAQDVEKFCPEVVRESVLYKGRDDYKSVAYGQLVAPLIQAIKELKAEKDAEIASIEETHGEEIAALEHRLSTLEEHTGYGPRRAGLPVNALFAAVLLLSIGGAGAAAGALIVQRRER
jgi:hypothetical protein